MTRISVVNQHTNNYGDDAAGAALLEELVQSLDVEVIDVHYIWHKRGLGIPVTGPNYSHHLYSLLSGNKDARPKLAMSLVIQFLTKKVVLRELRELVNRCREADHVMVSPAGANIGAYKDWTYLIVLASLVLAGVRPVFCLNTIGKSSSRLFNALSRWVLSRSEVHVRERRSQDYLNSIRVPSSLGVDTALASLPAAGQPTPETRYVAVVPTKLQSWHRDFQDFDDEQFLTSLLPDGIAAGMRTQDHELEIRIVPHLYGAESESDDIEFLRTALVKRGCAVQVSSPINFREYASDLRGAVAVVTMRYHGLVLAGQMGRPTVSLGYENKMVEAARYLGQSELHASVKHVSSGEVARLVGRALALANAADQRAVPVATELRELARGPVRSIVARQIQATVAGA